MKSNKLYITLTTVILSVAGLVATKAGNRHASFLQACFVGIPPSALTISSIQKLTSIKGIGARTLFAAARINNISSPNVHTAVTCTNGIIQLYLKP